MESRNVKVIDEHNIDRDALVICKIDVDGSDYVVYSIERDADNDNLFVSKLIKNNDGTSNMINIEDNAEKEKLSEIVRELVKYAINNEAEKTNGTVTLGNGKSINVSSVLFNKEQNINVVKTYVNTVKKSVTKVSQIFYKVEEKPVEEEVKTEVFEPIKDEAVMPEVPSEPVKEENPTEIEVMNSFVEAPKVEPVVETPVVLEPTLETPVAPPVVEPVLTETPKVEPVVAPVIPEPVMATPTVPPVVESVIPEAPKAESVVSEPVLTAPTVVPPVVEPVISEAPKVETPIIPQPVTQVVPPVESKLVFDGSKETNLNVALGEVSTENTIPVNNVEPIREFGQDEPVTVQPMTDTTNDTVASGDVAVDSTAKAGFANNKFFTVIAIVFFVAACVFLGYEVFNYFNLK